MAQEIQISGGPATAKIRSVIGVVALSIVTFGIYGLAWYYMINRELRDFGNKRGVDIGQSPGTSLLAVTLGAIVIVPALISLFNTYKRIRLAQEVAGVVAAERINGWIALLLWAFLGPVLFAYEQDALNRVWKLDSGAALPTPEAAPQFAAAGSTAPPPH